MRAAVGCRCWARAGQLSGQWCPLGLGGAPSLSWGLDGGGGGVSLNPLHEQAFLVGRLSSPTTQPVWGLMKAVGDAGQDMAV